MEPATDGCPYGVYIFNEFGDLDPCRGLRDGVADVSEFTMLE